LGTRFKQEQHRVAVGPENAQFMSIRQVSLRRGTFGRPLQRCSAAAAATALLLQLLLL